MLLCLVLSSGGGAAILAAEGAETDAGAFSVAGRANRIAPAVEAAVARHGEARVMIALDPAAVVGEADAEPAMAAPGIPDVSHLVDAVLERVGSEAFAVTRRYAAVAAVAGTIRDAAAIGRLEADDAVLRVDLDVGGRGALGGSVGQIGADTRHAVGNDGSGVVVAVLDTGVDSDHPALSGRIRSEACFGATGSGGFCPGGGSHRTGPGAATDGAGHGTHVTGIVAASGAVGDPGVAPAAEIVAVKVLDDSSFSGRFSRFSEIVAALDFLIVNREELDVRVVNMSLGTDLLFSGACDDSAAFNMAGSEAINSLRALGVIAFAASMNNGSSTQMASPACLENVVAVGAVDASDVIPASSNGNAATDLLAPGVQIRSLGLGGSLRTASGTSMASPHAAGCAALLVQGDPARTPESIAGELRESYVQVSDPRNGLVFPRLDCHAEPVPVDVTVSVEVSDTEPRMGDTVQLFATVTNQGEDGVPEVTVPIQFPADRLELESVQDSGGQFDPATGIWTIGTLGPGETAVLVLTAVVRVLEPESGP